MKIVHEDGEKDLYGEDLRSALMSGLQPVDVGVKTAKQWSVKTDSGKLYKFESLDDAVNAAKESGAQLWMPQDEIRQSTTATGTFIKEAASAATLGISDYFRDEETAKVEREAHPIASTMGQVAGSLVPGISVAKGVAAGAKAIKASAAISKAADTTSKATKLAGILNRPVVGAAVIGGAEGLGTGVAQVAKEIISPLDDVDMTHASWTIGAGLTGGAILGGVSGQFLRPDKLRADVMISTPAAKKAAKAIYQPESTNALNQIIEEDAKLINKLGLLDADPIITMNNIKGLVEKIKTKEFADPSEVGQLARRKFKDLEKILSKTDEITQPKGFGLDDLAKLGGFGGLGFYGGGPSGAILSIVGKMIYANPTVKLNLATAMENSIVNSFKNSLVPATTAVVAGKVVPTRVSFNTPEEYSEHLEVLNSIVTDGPTPEYQAYANKLDQMKPGMGEKVSSQLTQTSAFLKSKAPQLKVQPGLEGRVTMPTKTKMDAYSRYVTAATQPQTILETIKMGRNLSAEEKEVLNTLYPEMNTLISDILMDQVANKNVNKVAYKSVLGQGISPWEDKSWASYLQNSFTQGDAEEQQPSGKGIQSTASDRVRNKQGLSS